MLNIVCCPVWQVVVCGVAMGILGFLASWPLWIREDKPEKEDR